MEVAAACKEQKLYEYQGKRTLKFKLKKKSPENKVKPTPNKLSQTYLAVLNVLFA